MCKGNYIIGLSKAELSVLARNEVVKKNQKTKEKRRVATFPYFLHKRIGLFFKIKSEIYASEIIHLYERILIFVFIRERCWLKSKGYSILKH
jgi:hypothetical protein